MKTYFDPATLKWHEVPLTYLERLQQNFSMTTAKGNTTEDGVKAFSLLTDVSIDVSWERFMAILGEVARRQGANKFPECVHEAIDHFVEKAREVDGQL